METIPQPRILRAAARWSGRHSVPSLPSLLHRREVFDGIVQAALAEHVARHTNRLAGELGENPDALLALAGKVSSDLLAIIRARPTVVAELLRALRGLSAKRVSALSRQIRAGDW